jgi:hypothetical protein
MYFGHGQSLESAAAIAWGQRIELLYNSILTRSRAKAITMGIPKHSRRSWHTFPRQRRMLTKTASLSQQTCAHTCCAATKSCKA